MSLSNLAVSAGIASANPVLIGAGAFGMLAGGIFGQQTASRVANIQSEIAGLQNQIFAEQFNIEKENLLTRRRQAFRQGAIQSGQAMLASVASGQSRGTGAQVVQRSIEEQTQQAVGAIDTALEVGERITGLNQRITSLTQQAAETQARGGLFSAIF